MPDNVFGKRLSTALVQPWAATLGVGKTIFDYYDSQGDKTLSADTIIPSLRDGPMVVRRYNNLTLDASTGNVTLTTQYRCQGLLLLIDGNLTLQCSGSYVASISMTARGARGHAGMGLYDVSIPASIDLQGEGFLFADVLKRIRQNGWAVIDRWLWDSWGKIAGVKATAWTGVTVLLSASGCGAGALNAVATSDIPGGQSHGNNGAAGTNGGCGGGGGGGASYSFEHGGKGGSGRPWGGGSGGSAMSHNFTTQLRPHGYVLNADDFGGSGGDGGLNQGDIHSTLHGAGNPPGRILGSDTQVVWAQSGTGGVLIIVCKGNVTIGAGCVIQADGVSGGSGGSGNIWKCGGGSSGGGHVSVVCNGAYTNNGTVRASGGPATSGTSSGMMGGAGGAGSVVTKSFAQMGWS